MHSQKRAEENLFYVAVEDAFDDVRRRLSLHYACEHYAAAVLLDGFALHYFRECTVGPFDVNIGLDGSEPRIRRRFVEKKNSVN